MKSYLQSMVNTKTTISAIIVFNNCEDNILLEKVGYAGSMLAFYSPSYWIDHVICFVVRDKSIYVAMIDIAAYQLHNVAGIQLNQL